jgi:hypothetical protein
MIAALEKYDSVIAAGVLARAALELESHGSNPAGDPVLADESEIRRAVIAELRAKLGIGPNDESPEVIDILCDSLDELTDELIAEPNSDEALTRLAERGELPSDRFSINIIENIRDFYGEKFSDEEKRIVETIRSPLKEQHFGPPTQSEDPFLISLFARHYPNKFPYRNFYLLVAGQRDGLALHVHQVWRIYPSVARGILISASLIDILRQFAEFYGMDMVIGDQKGRFILSARLLPGIKETQALIDASNSDPRYIGDLFTITFFNQVNPVTGDLRASLAIAIDLRKYRGALDRMGW